MTNEVEKKGVIYFKVPAPAPAPAPTPAPAQDFCMLILRKFREEDEEEFIKIMFKVVKLFVDIFLKKISS